MRGGLQFNPNKTLVEIIKEGNFGGTYFRDIYSSVNGKWYKNSWKEFYQLKDIDQKYYCSSYYDVSVNKYGVKCETSLRFWQRSDRRSEDDEGKINKWKKVLSRFRGKLVKRIKDAGSKFNDYSISPKIRQILLYWGCQLTEKDFFIDLTN